LAGYKINLPFGADFEYSDLTKHSNNTTINWKMREKYRVRGFINLS